MAIIVEVSCINGYNKLSTAWNFSLLELMYVQAYMCVLGNCYVYLLVLQ